MSARIPGQYLVQSDTTTQPDVSHLDDDVRRYDWLFKDGPYHLGKPIVEHWAEQQTLSIKLGNTHIQHMDISPVEHLQRLIDEFIDPSAPFQIIADFDPGKWPLVQGYRRLGEYLAFLGTHELDFASWTNLEICLPDTAIPFQSPSTPLIPSDALTNLQYLSYFGHRNQLVNSWLPLTPSITQSLSNLDINCEISVGDCVRILLHGIRLRHFFVDNIEEDTDEVLVDSMPSPSKYRHGEHIRPHLDFLKIKSAADITPLLLPFFFPSLRTLSLVLEYPTKLKALPPAFEWKHLNMMSAVCDITDDDSQWIRNACGPDTMHTHINLSRYLEHAQ
ncbi:hypothetical protein C0991_007833 [Blastosporella zonata]|nr:hypothetical protein C0991_007833 [Blastosporella zonata]